MGGHIVVLNQFMLLFSYALVNFQTILHIFSSNFAFHTCKQLPLNKAVSLSFFPVPPQNPVEMLIKLTNLTRLKPYYDDSPPHPPALSHGYFILFVSSCCLLCKHLQPVSPCSVFTPHFGPGLYAQLRDSIVSWLCQF